MHIQQFTAVYALLHAIGHVAASEDKFDVLDLIDPLIGTANGG